MNKITREKEKEKYRKIIERKKKLRTDVLVGGKTEEKTEKKMSTVFVAVARSEKKLNLSYNYGVCEISKALIY